MKRVLSTAFFCAAFLLFAHSRAQAMIEFCPAALHIQPVGGKAVAADDLQTAPPAALYGFNLTAYGPRSVSAEIALDTTAGWYTFNVPQVTLTEKDRHYTLRGGAFVYHDYVSPVMYVRLPQPAQINHVWVYRSSAIGDGAFGWQARGDVICPPPPASSKDQKTHGDSEMRLDPADDDRLSAAPAGAAAVIPAALSKPLETASCSEPFREANVTSAARVDYPDYAREQDQAGTTAVLVAVNSDGSVADAWVFGTSGSKLLDESAVRSARMSDYSPARSYCSAVPKTYFFIVTFDPND